ncbi:MAG: ABC transporter ATP-binding protein [Treponemataceae bacterium]|nr:MAG: ABC transporter ATP-binding protein [Treponemataceae bacterium]
MTAILDISGLSVEITAKNAVFPVLRNIDLRLERKQVLGLVGESGCGKSMTAYSIMGLLPEGGAVSGGSISFQGEDLIAAMKKTPQKIRGRHIAMIFQEPMSSLNPLFTIGQQMSEVFYYHLGLKGAANRTACEKLLRAVNIPEEKRVYDYHPFRLSGGMRQRVMIAMALICEPELIIADEPTTALDVTTQAQILDLFIDLKKRTHSSFIFVSHDLGIIAEIADRVAVMYAGRIVEECSAAALFDMPLHPYTLALMKSRIVRRSGEGDKPLFAIPGTVPPPLAEERGCAFAPRCDKRTGRCEREAPDFFEAADSRAETGHKVRCWRFCR